MVRRAPEQREQPLWLGGSVSPEPWGGLKHHSHFWAGRRRSHAFTLSTLTTDVSSLSFLCKYLSLL